MIIFLYIVMYICKLGFDQTNMNKHVDSGNVDQKGYICKNRSRVTCKKKSEKGILYYLWDPDNLHRVKENLEVLS